MDLTNRPPVDIYEELIITDTQNNTIGFLSEGVTDKDGRWRKAGTSPNGDYLWFWTEKNSQLSPEEALKNSWIIRGNKPIYLKGSWLIMGLAPGIFYYKYGLKEQSRIEICDNVFLVDGKSRITAKEMPLNQFFEMHTNKINSNFFESIDEELEIQKSNTQEQLLHFFPLIELVDFIFDEFKPSYALGNYLRRLSYSFNSPVKFQHILSYMDNKVKSLSGEILEGNILENFENLFKKGQQVDATENLMLGHTVHKKQKAGIGLGFVFEGNPTNDDITFFTKQFNVITNYLQHINIDLN